MHYLSLTLSCSPAPFPFHVNFTIGLNSCCGREEIDKGIQMFVTSLRKYLSQFLFAVLRRKKAT